MFHTSQQCIWSASFKVSDEPETSPFIKPQSTSQLRIDFFPLEACLNLCPFLSQLHFRLMILHLNSACSRLFFTMFVLNTGTDEMSGQQCSKLFWCETNFSIMIVKFSCTKYKLPSFIFCILLNFSSLLLNKESVYHPTDFYWK